MILIKKDNSIKDMLEEKQQVIIKNTDTKTKKILPPEASNKKKYLKK